MIDLLKLEEISYCAEVCRKAIEGREEEELSSSLYMLSALYEVLKIYSLLADSIYSKEIIIDTDTRREIISIIEREYSYWASMAFENKDLIDSHKNDITIGVEDLKNAADGYLYMEGIVELLSDDIALSGDQPDVARYSGLVMAKELMLCFCYVLETFNKDGRYNFTITRLRDKINWLIEREERFVLNKDFYSKIKGLPY